MTKSLVYLLVFIFGTIGSYIPTLWGDNNFLSGWSILGGLIGGLFGVWVAIKVNDYF